ncbi:MAG: hypothetical protein AAFP86_04500, partial [Planctomycetota bacterium]
MLAPLNLLAALALPGAVHAAPLDRAAVRPAEEVAYTDLEITLDLSALESRKGSKLDEGHWRGSWTGVLHGGAVRVDLLVYDRTSFRRLRDASDVANVVYFDRSNRSRKEDVFFDFSVSQPFSAPVGELPFGWFAVHDVYDGTSKASSEAYVCGLGASFGFALEIRTEAPLESEAVDALQAWAAGAIRYTGALLDPAWSDDEADARYRSDAPDDLLAAIEKRKRKSTIVRTDHYIVFTDIGPGTLKAFTKALEENYDEIRSVFPFDEIEGERLLPVFYFRDRDDYIDWYVKNLGAKRSSAERSGGVASGDVYSTYHQAPKATVHIHEQTHQLFRNRLRLGGGGSWYQEGVAEYMSSKPGDLGEIKRRAKAEDGLVPLQEFVMVPSLLQS